MTRGRYHTSFKRMRYDGYRSGGISPTGHKSPVSTCQQCNESFETLASQTVAQNKIFSVSGTSDAVPIVRNALLGRGWIEKMPAKRMNLQNIENSVETNKQKNCRELERVLLSSLVQKYPPNFIWGINDVAQSLFDYNKLHATIINKLTPNTLWTTKKGLCSSMKRNYWFYIENVAEVNVPRSYDSAEKTETESFKNDFSITACTSLLKWLVSMAANERQVFHENGQISIDIVLFALDRCKEYLYSKQNKDIDQPAATVTEEEWKTFLKCYASIIRGDDIFQTDQVNKLPIYLDDAKHLLQEMYRYRPQLSCEGFHNIWIIKPAHNCRGRGIRIASRLEFITELLNRANKKYVIQKYIEDPLLIHETKFDIRQYYLVTSTFPLVIWMYRDCYLKFSSKQYNLKNYHESIHLTNNAVQKKYRNWEGRHGELPSHNMWDSERYKKYLKKIGRGKAWEYIIFPGMKKSIISTMLSCQDSLTISKNRFEMYGCDFILDKEYKPWLIEINSRPDLNHTTQVTAKICSSAVADVIKVVIDFPNDPLSSTGKFECIYRQPMTTPKYGLAPNLSVRGWALRDYNFNRGDNEVADSYNIDLDKDVNSTEDTETFNKKLIEKLQSVLPTQSESEKNNFVTCTFQSKTYTTLKAIASEAIRQNKIFSIDERSHAIPLVRKALMDRGWIEKIPHRMMFQNITNDNQYKDIKLHWFLLSSFVENCPPNFIWRSNDETTSSIDLKKENSTTLVNKLSSHSLCLTMQGLCSSMKRNYWFYIEDVAEVNVPRSYNSSEDSEKESFIKDYKITACTSLLKWIVSMAANERPVFNKSGEISTNIILFALNRCKEYLHSKKHKDIDQPVTTVTEEQWNAFLKNYYRIIGGDDIFQADQVNKQHLDYAKYLLQEMYRYRPQLSCEGCHNIWIIKPAHNSRGKDVRVASKLEHLNIEKPGSVLQKYIEDPLLIHETKFDIRQYYLVTSTFPLIIWMYRDCYLKFSSQQYNIRNYHESIHLTNNGIPTKYENGNSTHEELASYNIWDSEKYKEYLNRIDRHKVWDNIIYPGMKKSIICTMLSGQDSLTISKNRFELYGCDFILDKDYKPWLIEINSGPDLNQTTHVTAKICSSVVEDVIKVVIDYPSDPSSSIGKFECIYNQPMTIPKHGIAAELCVHGCTLRNDYFFTGDIEVTKSYENDDDITGIMDKINSGYDVEMIMKEPDEDSDAHDREYEAFRYETRAASVGTQL